VEAFDRAYKRGVEWVTREPVRSRELLAKYTKTPPELASRISLHEYRLTIDPNELTLLADLARRHGLLREPPAADRLLAPTARGR